MRRFEYAMPEQRDSDGFIDRSTGPRREPDIDLGVLVCDRCGTPVVNVYTLADVGIFCSAECREKAAGR